MIDIIVLICDIEIKDLRIEHCNYHIQVQILHVLSKTTCPKMIFHKLGSSLK